MLSCRRLAVVVFLALFVTVHSQAKLVQDGLQLASAIADLGNGIEMFDTLLLGSPYISLRGVPFATATNSTPEPPDMVLTIQPAPNITQPVLDTAMRIGLTTPTFGPTQTQLVNVTLINKCEVKLARGEGRIQYSSLVPVIFAFSFSIQGTKLDNVTSYGRQADMSGLLMNCVALYTPFSRVSSLLAFAFDDLSGSEATVFSVTPYSVVFAGFNIPTLIAKGYTFKSTSNPDDPLLQSLKAAGNLIPPRAFDGSLVPNPDAEVDPLLPLWLASKSSELSAALTKAAALSLVQPVGDAPPSVYICNDIRLIPLPSPLQVSRILWIMGPGAGNPTVPARGAVLDLAKQLDVLTLLSGAQLYMQQLILTGLSTGSSNQSALPIRAFTSQDSSDTWLSAPYLWFHNVTLVLPNTDYLALLSLVLGDSQSKLRSYILQDSTISTQATQLQSGITVASLGTTAPDWQWFSLSLFTGLGINATSLILKPAMPLSSDVMATYQQLAAAGSSTDSTNHTAIILGCTLGLGIPVFLVAAVVLIWIIKRHRSESSHATHSGRDRKSDLEYGDTIQIHHANPELLETVKCSEQLAASQLGLRSLHVQQPRPSQVALHLSDTQHRVVNTLHNQQSPKGGLADYAPSSLPVLIQSSNTDNTETTQEGTSTRGSIEPPISPLVPSMLNLRFEAQMPQTATAEEQPMDMLRQVQDLSTKLHPIDTYTVVIKSILGKGSSGVVYAGVWRGLPVAVKTMIFSHTAAKSPQAIMEVAIAASVGHPNVVATYCYDIKRMGTHHEADTPGALQITMDMPEAHANAYGADEYKVYLVQELCGLTLLRALNTGTILSADDSTDARAVCLLLLDVAKGLEYVHSRSLVHGDLKPANVLLKVDPDAPLGVRAKLADFGLSVHLGGDGATHISGYSCGTPFYVAPEVIYERRASPASDMYSFGVMMWQVWMRNPPYQPTPDGQPTGQYNWAFPNFFATDMPPTQFDALMKQCLQRDPVHRPTASQAAAELLLCLRHLATQIPMHGITDDHAPTTPAGN